MPIFNSEGKVVLLEGIKSALIMSFPAQTINKNFTHYCKKTSHIIIKNFTHYYKKLHTLLFPAQTINKKTSHIIVICSYA